MIRKYDNKATYEQAKMFTGVEVEKTIHHGLYTLFVDGIIDPQEIKIQADTLNVKHIYLGANKSFPSVTKYYPGHPTIDTLRESEIENLMTRWEDMIYSPELSHYPKTFDYHYMFHTYVEQMITTHEAATEMAYIMSIDLPNFAKNHLHRHDMHLKIDSVNFARDSQGVYVVPFENITKEKYLTRWHEYSKDTMVE